MANKLTALLDAKEAARPQGQPYGLSTAVAAPELPERAGVLPMRLQDIARSYLGARRQSGVSLLEAARWLSEAKQAAKHGEWSIFLEAIGLDESRARAQIRIHEEAQRDPVFADRIINGYVSEAVAREMLSLPEETREELLAREEPITREEIRDAKRAPAPVLETAPFWQSLSPNHPTAHLWTRERPDLWRSACGIVTQNRAPSGSTDAGHCSSCVRATWPQNQTTPAPNPNFSELPPAAPGLTDILLRLDAHGYAKTSTRQKGSTIYHSFRDYRGDHEESGGELELAEGELSFWLAELDDNARRALARQEQFLDMQQRFAVFDWNLRRENKEFGLYKPNGGCVGVWKNLDQHMRQLNELERSRANRIARGDPAYAAERAAAAQPDPTILHLPMDFTDAQKRAAKIDLFIAMDMNGMFSIKNAGGSGVDHIAEWASLLRHLAYSEQAAAEIAAERAARQAPAPAAEPSEPNDGREDVRKRVIDLLTRLEPLMKWLKAEDIEGLSQAINDLNECEEGTEAEHWLKVGYALCDVEDS